MEEADDRSTMFDDADVSDSSDSDTESENDSEIPTTTATPTTAGSFAATVNPPHHNHPPTNGVKTEQQQQSDSVLFFPPTANHESSTSGGGPSSRLFQKLWTDEDELIILQGFYEFTSSRGTTHADYQYDTGPFYEQIKAKLQLEFTKNQLIEKLRRLKKKYRTAVARTSQGKPAVFKSPHDRATFEISRQIWSPVFKRSQSSNNNGGELKDHNNGSNNSAAGTDRRQSRRRRVSVALPQQQPTPMQLLPDIPLQPVQMALPSVPPQILPPQPMGIPVAEELPQQTTGKTTAARIPTTTVDSVVEETVQSCLSPLFKDLIGSALKGRGAGLVGRLVTPLGFAGVGGNLQEEDERWRKQRIMELEVYSKRLELVQEEIKMKLQELQGAQLMTTTTTSNTVKAEEATEMVESAMAEKKPAVAGSSI